MQIIHTTSALAPEFGGPVRTVPALCYEMAKQGHNVTVVHLEFRDYFNTIELPSHPNLEYVPVTVTFSVGLRPVLIPSYRQVLLDLVTGKDDLIIHDNGIWLAYSGLLLKIARDVGAKIITTTHGMLEPWAMEYGKIRKNLAWYLYQKGRLKENNILHATSHSEAKNIRKLGLNVPLTVIPNGTILPGYLPSPKQPDSEKKTALFLSRIHPKKGLLNLVKAVDETRPTDWKFIIAGYNENGHQEVIQEAVLRAGLSEFFSFPGPVDDQKKWQLYRSANLFVLPSFSENFGMVIAEALAAELPVITTRGTPWKDLDEYNCGWWVEPTAPALVKALREAFALENRKLRQMGRNGRQLVENKYSWSSIATDMINVYSWMLENQGKQPDTII